MEVGVGCMRYFGIKSYLDNFYNRQGDNEQHKNFNPKFSSRWWKLLLWFSLLLVLSGLVVLLISFFLPRKKIHVDSDVSFLNPQILIIDRQAVSYNSNLDTSHFLGICLVVTGGVLFALSLLIPTFCHMWCASGDVNDETDLLKLQMNITNSEGAIPVRSILKSNYGKNESRLTTE